MLMFFYPLYIACLSTSFNITWGTIGNCFGIYVQPQLKSIKSTGVRHTKYRVKLQKYMFIDNSHCGNGEIDTSIVRVLKRFKMCRLSLYIGATVRTHFFLGHFVRNYRYWWSFEPLTSSGATFDGGQVKVRSNLMSFRNQYFS